MEPLDSSLTIAWFNRESSCWARALDKACRGRRHVLLGFGQGVGGQVPEPGQPGFRAVQVALGHRDGALGRLPGRRRGSGQLVELGLRPGQRAPGSIHGAAGGHDAGARRVLELGQLDVGVFQPDAGRGHGARGGLDIRIGGVEQRLQPGLRSGQPASGVGQAALGNLNVRRRRVFAAVPAWPGPLPASPAPPSCWARPRPWPVPAWPGPRPP